MDTDLMFSSATGEWNTPETILNHVDRCFDVDLDPASPGSERTLVTAKQYYTKEQDGLKQEWHGRVYLNPPYGRQIGLWTTKLRAEFIAKRCSDFIALLPARTDTLWYRGLLMPTGCQDQHIVVCFLWGRIKFLDPEFNEQDPAPFPSVLVYGGSEPGHFSRVMKDIGDTYWRYPLDYR